MSYVGVDLHALLPEHHMRCGLIHERKHIEAVAEYGSEIGESVLENMW
jgi:hypothetical protein